MSRAEFERKAGLELADSDGALKEADAMAPMHTWLNRVLALRSADQNLLFATFEAILAGVLERAEATGQLERGMENVDADELDVVSEEVVRTDTATGAETRLVTVAVRTRREVSTADTALRWLERVPAAVSKVVNSKTGEAALVERGLTTTDDKDRLVPAVQLHGHLRRRRNLANTFAGRPGRRRTRASGARLGTRRSPPPTLGARTNGSWRSGATCPNRRPKCGG